MDNSLIISDVNKVVFTSQNLTLEANRKNRRSLIRFNNYPKTKHSFDYRQVFLLSYCFISIFLFCFF